MNITLAFWRELYRFEDFDSPRGGFPVEIDDAKVIAQARRQVVHAMLTKLTPG
jgi:hypothetical protein